MLNVNWILILLLLQGITGFGQDVLKVDKSIWGKEHFQFPLGFATNIEYEGHEEAVFPQYWNRKDSSDFWSYAFVWSIAREDEVQADELETNMQYYFDGLMNSVNKEQELELPKTVALFVKKELATNPVIYKGKVQIYDAFVTKKNLILNVYLEQHFCADTKKTQLLFRFSPKSLEHPIWTKLQTIEIAKDSAKD